MQAAPTTSCPSQIIGDFVSSVSSQKAPGSAAIQAIVHHHNPDLPGLHLVCMTRTRTFSSPHRLVMSAWDQEDSAPWHTHGAPKMGAHLHLQTQSEPVRSSSKTGLGRGGNAAGKGGEQEL